MRVEVLALLDKILNNGKKKSKLKNQLVLNFLRSAIINKSEQANKN